MRLVIHIGQPKTGTTSIQSACYEHTAILAQHGVCYPRFSGVNHGILSWPFFHDHLPRVASVGFASDRAALAESERRWQELVQLSERVSCETLFLSGEAFFDITDFTLLKQHLARLADRIRSIDILVYLRQPSASYVSLAQQRLKKGQQLPPLARVELHKKVTPWKEIGEVHIREFSRETLTRGDAVADAVSFCLGDDAELVLPSLRLNTSLSAEGMALLQKLSRDCYSQDQPTAHVPAAIRRLRDLLQRIEADYSGHFTKPKPLEGVVAHLDSHDEDLERLSVDFGFRFTSFDSPSADGASCGKTLDVADVKDLVCVDPAKFDHLQTLVLHELLKEEPRSPLSALAAALKGRIRSSRLGTLARMLRRRGPWSKSPDRRL